MIIVPAVRLLAAACMKDEAALMLIRQSSRFSNARNLRYSTDRNSDWLVTLASHRLTPDR